jgi:hypothetical protein
MGNLDAFALSRRPPFDRILCFMVLLCNDAEGADALLRMLFANRHWRGRAKVPEQRQSAYPQFGRSQGAVEIVRVEAGPIKEAHQSIHQVAGAMRSGMLVTPAEAFALFA